MRISPQWLKVIRDLWDNKSRTLLVVLSITVGVVAFGGLFATQTNLLNNLSIQFNASNAYDVSVRIPQFDDDLLRWVRTQDGVLAAQALTIHQEELVVDEEVYDVLLYGFRDFSDIQVNRVENETGALELDRFEIFLERSYVSALGIELGDPLTVQVGDDQRYTFPFTGTVHDINVQSGVVSSVVQGYVSHRTLHRMNLNADYNTLYLRLDRASIPDLTTYMDEFTEELERRGVVVGTPTINQEREHWAADNVSGLITILIIVGFFALVLSGFLVINTISGLMAQQRKQVGIMKIIGASRWQIIGIYIVMVASFGVMTIMLALPLSALLARALVQALGPNFINFDIVAFQLPILVVITEVSVAMLAPLLSAIGPVWGGTRVTAAQAISDYNARSSNNIVDVLLARVSGLPTPFLIALRNTFRRKLRLVMTLITLTLAGAFFTAIMNVRAAVQVDVVGIVSMELSDLQAVMARPYDIRGLERRALATEGVVAAEGRLSIGVTRTRPDGVSSEQLTLIGLPYDSPFIAPDMYTGEWLAPPDGTNRRDIVVSQTLLETEPDINVGDIITINYEGEEDDWRVVGFTWAAETPGTVGSAAFSYHESVANFADLPDRANRVMVETDTEVPNEQALVETALIDTYDRFDIEVSSTSSFRDTTDAILGVFDVILALLIITAVMIAIVGGLGLAGTMSLSVMERTREVGVMRSVGASNMLLRLMFIGEGIIIGLLSFLLSLAISIPFTAGFATVLGNTIRGRPWSTVLAPEGPMIWLVIVLAVSVVASLLPAQRASQISIREALSYE
ncbi:MAG: ABC transporter permease [Chloroflexota bacterium]